ncbi:unnamed protein product [Diamesa serratosioi]
MAVVAIVAASPVPEPSPEAKPDPQVIVAGPAAIPAAISWNGLAISSITGLPVPISQALQLAPGTVLAPGSVVWPNGLISSSPQIIQIA